MKGYFDRYKELRSMTFPSPIGWIDEANELTQEDYEQIVGRGSLMKVISIPRTKRIRTNRKLLLI